MIIPEGGLRGQRHWLLLMPVLLMKLLPYLHADSCIEPLSSPAAQQPSRLQADRLLKLPKSRLCKCSRAGQHRAAALIRHSPTI